MYTAYVVKSHKRILKIVAKNHKVDPDEVLISLWYYPKFNYIKDENSVIKGEDILFVKSTIISNIVDKKEKIVKKKVVDTTTPIYKEYVFTQIGDKVNEFRHIKKEEIDIIYNELLADSMTINDPIFPRGIRDEGLLDSALFHPQTSFDGHLKYGTVQSAAAALMYSISNNHAFHNGNKRTAMVAMLVFLDRHNINLVCAEVDLFKISLQLADHSLVEKRYLCSDAEIYELACWLNKHSKPISKGERPITLRKLKRILSRFECKILDNGKVERIERGKNFFGVITKTPYISKKAIPATVTDGNIVNMSLVKSIRDDLKLNAENGKDSDVFYEDAEFTSSEFILKYKNLLRRLSKT